MNSDDPVAPYETLVYHGNSIKLDTKGKTVVVPTGNPTLLPLFNEYVENADRLTTAESPFGGMKGSYPPDYAVGTVYTPTEGIYLTDIAGNNSTKTLTAGKLTELGLLTVDTDAHTITEEFIVANTAESNNPTVIDACDATTNWTPQVGRGVISLDTVDFIEGTGSIKLTSTGSNAEMYARCTFASPINFSNVDFIVLTVKGTSGKTMEVFLESTGANRYWSPVITYNGNWQKIVIPVKKYSGDTGVALSAALSLRIDLNNPDGNSSLLINNITADTVKPAYIELQTPDNLAPSSLRVEVYDQNVSQYYHAWTAGLDTTYTLVTSDSSRFRTLDGTSFNDIYGSWGGRGLFLKGTSGATVNGYYSGSNSAGTMTYSANQGTSKRIGLRVDLPPSDGGRTNFNKVQLKLVINYTDTVGNVVPDLSGNNNTGTILANVSKTSDSYLFGSVNTVKAIEHATVTHSAGTIEFITDVMRGNKTGWGMIASFGGYAFTKGWYIGWENNILKVKVNDGVASKMAQWDDPTSSTRKTIRLLIDQVAKTIIVYADGNIVINDTFPLVGDITPVASTPFLIGSDGISTDSLHGAIYSYSLSYNGYKVLDVVPTLNHMGSTTHDFADSTNASYGLHHMVKPWIALLEDDTQEIDFYLFDERPKNLKYKQDESGKIYELEVFPGNGNCYHGRIKYSGLTRDTNSDGIPDCLDPSVEGSIANFLRTYDFAKDWYYEYDLSASAISANDFSITEESLDIVPFAVPEGDSVSDENNVVRPVVETVAGADGNISIYDVKGLDTVRVRDSPYTNAGECKVFDTVTAGNTTESTWIRVYRTDWVFTGDCIVENGIVRTRFGGQTYFQNPSLYRYNSGTGTYTKYNGYHVMAQAGIVASSVKFVTFSKFTTDEIIVIAESTYGGYYASYTLSINRGSPHVKIISTAQLKFEPTDTVSTRRGRFATNGTLLDDAELTSTSSTLSGSWGATLDPEDTFIRVFTQTEGSFTYYWNDTYKKYYSIFQSTHVPNKQKTIAAIPYSSQMYWEAESLTGYGKTVVSDVDTYSGQAVEIRRPENYNNYITVNLTGMCVANQKIKIYVRAKCTLADKLQLYVHSTSSSRIIASVDPVLTIGSYAYYSLEFTPLSIDLGKAVNFYLKNMCDIGAEYPITVDYIVAVPTGLIETQAKRALWNASPMTSTLKSSKR